MNSTIKIAANIVEELNQRNENSDTKKGRHTAYKSKFRRRILKEKKLESKTMHGQYIRSINR
jgi:hypothetical protein